MKIEKHIEILVNTGNFQHVIIGNRIEDEIQEGETTTEAHFRLEEEIMSMMFGDISYALEHDTYYYHAALKLAGLDFMIEDEDQDDHEGDTKEFDTGAVARLSGDQSVEWNHDGEVVSGSDAESDNNLGLPF